MANKEMNRNPGPGGPGGPGPRPGEQAKDLVGTWKKLLGYCKQYLAVIIIAVICAAAGTILTLLGPDKLSDMTNTITEGLVPDTVKLEEVTTAISENMADNLELVMGSITEGFSDEARMQEKTMQIMASADIPEADKLAFQQILINMGAAEDQSAAMVQMFSLPESILCILFSDIEVNDVVIPTADQLQLMQLFSASGEGTQEEMLAAMQQLPESVEAALYTELTIGDTLITSADQMAMMELLSDMDPEDSDAALSSMDALPESIYSLIEPSMDMDTITAIGMTLVCFYAAGYVLSVIQSWSMASVTQKVSKRLRTDISRKINRLPMWYYNRTSAGDVLSRVTNDVDTIGQSLNQSIGNLVHSIILFLGSLIMMLTTNGIMTLTAVLSTLIGFVFMFMIMGRSQKYFVRQQRQLGAINGYIEEIYTGQTVVKAYNGEEYVKKTFDEMNSKMRDAGFKAQCLSGMMQPLMGFIGNFGYVAVCVVGGALALDGKIEFGTIVAFMMYVRYFTQPLSQIAQAMQSLQSAAAAGERVFEFLEAEEMQDESKKTKSIDKAKGYVDFSHVKFGYEDSDRTIIHDFSASAKPGQKIAIVGPTGAGKTTMVNLLMRFHEIQSGEIRIDGIPTKELTRENVHSQFCMVLQDTWLFEGTIRENLIYCAEGATDEKMREACKAVGLHHFIRTLPKGYDTVLNDQVNLSQGQKQQLTIARAMIADRPMLILDEATSSVDTRTERKIQEAMDKLMENRTSFVIAHRLSTIKNSDLILVLKDGDIIESGTHNDLLAKGGFYAELYNSQFDEAV